MSITYEQKKIILQDLVEGLKRQAVGAELHIRFLNRLKLKCKDNELLAVEAECNNFKKLQRSLELEVDTAEDAIGELSK